MITFAYPGYNPTVFLDLPSPQIGDTDIGNDEIIIHPTKGGNYKTVVHRDDALSTTLQFEVCQRKSEILAFFAQARKEYIKYTDYNGKVWMCQMTNDKVSMTNSPTGPEFSIDVYKWEMVA